MGSKIKMLIGSINARADWKKVAKRGAALCGEALSDGVLWLAGILVLSLANAAVGFLPLRPPQRELLETVHMNAVYATILVASSSIITRMVVETLERLRHWVPGQMSE